MKYILLLAVCGPAYAENSNGQINVQLTILPSCAVASQHGQYRTKCNIADTPQPKITESRIPTEQATPSAAKTAGDAQTRLITIEW